MSTHRAAMNVLFRRYIRLGKPFLVWPDIMHEYLEFRAEAGKQIDGSLDRLMRLSQEGAVNGLVICLAVRQKVVTWQYVEIDTEVMFCREISSTEYLRFKERVVDRHSDEWMLELDLSPFERGFPKMTETRSIGRGVEFLNRYLSGRMFNSGDGLQRLFEFLTVHAVRGEPLMLNGATTDLRVLRARLRSALELLHTRPPQTPWPDVRDELRAMGFEPGWGRDAGGVADTMELLSDILEAPSPDSLVRFLSRIPMIFSVVILSPHGYFAQSGVLGKPDTGGQIVYILDQVRALERTMTESIHDYGLDVEPQILVVTRLIPEADNTTCDERLEAITGTEHSRILRVPFRDAEGNVLRPWISRFRVWPYLEHFAADTEREIVSELGGRPDFLIGNYSDGNLVASILAHRLGVTQCNIAHALEKTKYLHSDVYWKNYDDEYHFSVQHTADLISMNMADFIITSTYQEIAGTRDAVGQYESYSSFTMPGLYRVASGIDCFDPRFNIVSPGVDEGVFFPYSNHDSRPSDLTEEVRRLVFGPREDGRRGELAAPEKPIIFAMSRLDQVKNMAGLLEWYADSAALRERANLLIVGGKSKKGEEDGEEVKQMGRIEKLLEGPELGGKVRWVADHLDRVHAGELYRVVADGKGAFVQPAFFEAFGLTVIEAMSSGLPTFATCFGGPREVIQDEVSGFHIDPNVGDEAADRMVRFFDRSRDEEGYWNRISDAGLERVRSHYTWRNYATRLLSLSRVYGFWKHISRIEREETRRYLEMFFSLMYRPLARKCLEDRP
jgi:sucrose synthase